MDHTLTAGLLAPGSAGTITHIALTGPLRRRLLELGLIPGQVLVRRYTAPAGSPIAFEVQGMVVALRSRDAGGILVREDAPWRA